MTHIWKQISDQGYIFLPNHPFSLFCTLIENARHWKNWLSTEKMAENSHHLSLVRDNFFLKASACKWMIYAHDHWLSFQKNSMVKIILACQTNHSTYFAPKTSLNGLRKMPTISHLCWIKKFQEHHFIGGLFIHLTIDSF